MKENHVLIRILFFLYKMQRKEVIFIFFEIQKLV